MWKGETRDSSEDEGTSNHKIKETQTAIEVFGSGRSQGGRTWMGAGKPTFLLLDGVPGLWAVKVAAGLLPVPSHSRDNWEFGSFLVRLFGLGRAFDVQSSLIRASSGMRGQSGALMWAAGRGRSSDDGGEQKPRPLHTWRSDSEELLGETCRIDNPSQDGGRPDLKGQRSGRGSDCQRFRLGLWN